MSVTVTPTPDPQAGLASRVMEWSRPAIALFAMCLMTAALFIASRQVQHATLDLLSGGILSLINLIAGFYFGSSRGSEKKDEMLSRTLPNPPPAPVGTPTSPPPSGVIAP